MDSHDLELEIISGEPGFGSGNSNSDGDGLGDGGGNGYGDSSGYGHSAGNGFGDGDGYGRGDGYGSSHGDGHGGGDGYGSSHGDGHGRGLGDGQADSVLIGQCHYENSRVFVSHDTPIIAWWRMGEREHFGKPLPVDPGSVHEWPYEPALCQHGLHACWRGEDTRKYNDGSLYRVACSGWVCTDGVKLVCTRRVVLEEVNHE